MAAKASTGPSTRAESRSGRKWLLALSSMYTVEIGTWCRAIPARAAATSWTYSYS